EQGEGPQDPACAAARARAPGAAVRDRRQPEGDGRDGRALGEDPDVQLSPEPRDRPPRERDPAQPRPRHRRRSRRLRRCARDAPASRGAGGGGLMDLGQALTAAVDRLAAAGVAEPRADAEVLLAHALGTTRAGLVASAGRSMPADAAGLLDRFLDRRARREPLQYVVGEREFWSLPIAGERRGLL